MATHTIDRLVDANGDEFVFSDPDVSNKLDKNGDGSDVTVGFTEATNRTNIATGSKFSTLFGQIRKWFADLKALAFKDKVGTSDVESGTYPIDINGNAATATTASTLSASAITSGDLDDYRSGGRKYFCNNGNSPNVSNKPSGVTGAFALDVIAHSGGITQLLYSRDSNYSYIRCYKGTSTWTDWDRFSMASDANGAYFATYGSTSHADVLAANQAGKVVFCISGTDYAPLTGISSTRGVITFAKSTTSGVTMYYQLSTADEWSSGKSKDCRVAFSAVGKSENTSDGCTLKFTALDGSTKSVTVRNVVNAGNADTVDGYHIVLGSPNGAANTIFLA